METHNNSQICNSNDLKESIDTLQICGFWKRLFAFMVDCIILGIFGLSIGTLFFTFFAEIGVLGLLAGFTVALLYFGIQNSSICNGQTIGKRILRIQVVDLKTETISLSRSLSRYMVLGLPYFLNGANLPDNLLNNSFVSLLLNLIVFFGLTGIIYLYVFNRKTRQSLHDLVTSTYVINAPIGKNYTFCPRNIWKGHLVVLGFIFLTITVFITIVTPKLTQNTSFNELLTIQNTIQDSGLAQNVSVFTGKSFRLKDGTNNQAKWLSVTTALKAKPSDYDETIKKIAGIILNTNPSIAKNEMIIIKVSYGYNIGISNSQKSQTQSHTLEEWQTRLSGKSNL